MTELSSHLVRGQTKRESRHHAGRTNTGILRGLSGVRPFLGISVLTAGPAKAACLLAVTAVGILLLSGCDVAPRKPEDVYSVYREHMRSGRLEEARKLLTRDCRELAVNMSETFKLGEAPEKLAIFNALDPAGPPLIMKQGDNYTLIQVRTLRGGLRLVRLVRKDAESPWRIDISEELNALRRFLRIRGALDMFREQAGEYAEAWKAFNDQLEKMNVPRELPPEPETAGKQGRGRGGPKRQRGTGHGKRK